MPLSRWHSHPTFPISIAVTRPGRHARMEEPRIRICALHIDPETLKLALNPQFLETHHIIFASSEEGTEGGEAWRAVL